MGEDNDKRSFWTDPEGMSIIDILSLGYSITYLSVIIANIFIRKELLITLMNSMTPIILLILGGYFGGQAVQQYNISKDKYLKRKDD